MKTVLLHKPSKLDGFLRFVASCDQRNETPVAPDSTASNPYFLYVSPAMTIPRAKQLFRAVQSHIEENKRLTKN